MTGNRDWIFCPVTGDLLRADGLRGVATCPACGFERSLAEAESYTMSTEADMEEFKRRYDLDMVVKSKAELELQADLEHTNATVEEECPKCGHGVLEYYTMQLRSADEGQTVFYRCPECNHKYSQNT